MKRPCAHCGKSFEAKRATAKYCSGSCRAKASQVRAGKRDAPEPTGDPVQPLPLVESLAEAIRAELEAAGRDGSVLGVQAIALARRIDHSVSDTGSAVASLSKELRAVMEAAMTGIPAKADALDELGERRRRKASGA